MAGRLSVTGTSGQVRWGYLPAATFAAWKYEGSGTTGTLTTSQVLDCDELRLDQAPLVVVVPMGHAEWRWSVESLVRSGDSLTIQVSRQ